MPEETSKPVFMLTVDTETLTAQMTAELRAVIAARVDESLHEYVQREVNNALRKRVIDLTDDDLRKDVAAVLAEGWATTDRYGEPTGKKVTLRAFVLDYLTKGDSYSNPLQSIFKAAVDAELKGELRELLTDAKAKLRSMLDTTIADKLRGAVTEALKT